MVSGGAAAAETGGVPPCPPRDAVGARRRPSPAFSSPESPALRSSAAGRSATGGFVSEKVRLARISSNEVRRGHGTGVIRPIAKQLAEGNAPFDRAK